MKNLEAIETVKEIRSMMEKSSRFISFSGTSAILIGFYALAGSFIARSVLASVNPLPNSSPALQWSAVAAQLVITALLVFVLALGTILFFSVRKAKKRQQSFFNKPAYRTFFNFFLPLATGGVFCMALLLNGYVGVIAPVMLLFYGVSLINAAKYTFGSIFGLGCAEIVLGLLCAFFPGKGLLFWSAGFGVLHILYGIYFYVSVERKERLS